MIVAREKAGKSKRRSRKRLKPRSINNPKVVGEDFNEMFQRIVRYKDEHGDCQVSKNYKKDRHVSCIFQIMMIFIEL